MAKHGKAEMMKNSLKILFLSILVALTSCGKNELTSIGIQTDSSVVSVNSVFDLGLVPSFTKEETSEVESFSILEDAGLIWTSDNEKVASVAAGTVTTHKPGTATIAVTDVSGKIGDSVDITVVQPLQDTELPENIDLTVEEEVELEIALFPADASDVEISCTSSDPDVANVDDLGKLSAVASGEATVTVSITAYNADAERENTELTVEVVVKPAAEGIGLDENEISLVVDDIYQVEPYIIPEDAVESTYTFASSDAKVASVDADGLITAQSVGTVTITVTNEEGHSADLLVTVVHAGIRFGQQNTATSNGTNQTGGSGNDGNGGAGGSGSNSGSSGGDTPTGGGNGGNTSGGTGGGNNTGDNDWDPGDGSRDRPADGGTVVVGDNEQSTDGTEGDGWDSGDGSRDRPANGGIVIGDDDGQSTEGTDGDAW